MKVGEPLLEAALKTKGFAELFGAELITDN